jgi:hypothetical protein
MTSALEGKRPQEQRKPVVQNIDCRPLPPRKGLARREEGEVRLGLSLGAVFRLLERVKEQDIAVCKTKKKLRFKTMHVVPRTKKDQNDGKKNGFVMSLSFLAFCSGGSRVRRKTGGSCQKTCRSEAVP